jgi:hypothetical protein
VFADVLKKYGAFIFRQYVALKHQETLTNLLTCHIPENFNPEVYEFSPFSHVRIFMSQDASGAVQYRQKYTRVNATYLFVSIILL